MATGLTIRRGTVLLVASKYAPPTEVLWNLPGGRQTKGELLMETVVREVLEETGLKAVVKELAYVSESFDGNRHFLNATFRVEVHGEIHVPKEHDHIADVAWVPFADVDSRPMAAVVRDPLLAHLEHRLDHRYAGFHSADISVSWGHEA